MDREALKAQLVIDEAKRNRLYKDSVDKWTIGVGHNIEDKGLSDTVISIILDEDIDEKVALLDKYLPWWRKMDEPRQNVLANMAFNMGVGPSPEEPLGQLLTFRRTLVAMETGNYAAAAAGMAASLWARQVGKRAERLIAVMSGE